MLRPIRSKASATLFGGFVYRFVDQPSINVFIVDTSHGYYMKTYVSSIWCNNLTTDAVKFDCISRIGISDIWKVLRTFIYPLQESTLSRLPCVLMYDVWRLIFMPFSLQFRIDWKHNRSWMTDLVRFTAILDLLQSELLRCEVIMENVSILEIELNGFSCQGEVNDRDDIPRGESEYDKLLQIIMSSRTVEGAR